MAWPVDEFVQSLTAESPNTVAAYRSDVVAFVAWALRGGHDGPASVDRIVLRRYLAFLSTKGLARRTMARKVASLRRLFGYLARRGLIPLDPTIRLQVPAGTARVYPALRQYAAKPVSDSTHSAESPVPCRNATVGPGPG